LWRIELCQEQINKDEKKIIAELQKHANKSIDIISKNCGFSRQKTWRVIKNLEEKNLIWGYTAIIDEMKNGLNHYTLLIKRDVKKLDEKTIDLIVSRKLEEVATEIGATVENSYYVNGEYDWLLTFTAPDLWRAKKFCNLLLTMHLGILSKITLLETLFVVEDHHILNPEKKKLKEFL
jgi:Lrp/AsnC family leucine-responsive transcriptional regulator